MYYPCLENAAGKLRTALQRERKLRRWPSTVGALYIHICIFICVCPLTPPSPVPLALACNQFAVVHINASVRGRQAAQGGQKGGGWGLKQVLLHFSIAQDCDWKMRDTDDMHSSLDLWFSGNCKLSFLIKLAKWALPGQILKMESKNQNKNG